MTENEELVRLTVRSKDGQNEHKIRMVRINPNGHLAESAVQFMIKYFLPRETMNTILGLENDDISVKFLTGFWREKVSQGNSIAAMPVDKDELMAVNVTYVLNKGTNELMDSGDGKVFHTIGEVLKQLMECNDIFEMYKVDKYLNAMGLTVHPQYHGLGLGLEVLKARKPLCKKLGLTCSATIFTSPVSQGLASKAGFQETYSKRYIDFIVNGEKPFENVDPNMCIKVMARTYSF